VGGTEAPPDGIGVVAGLAQAQSNPTIRKAAIVKHVLAIRDLYMVLNISSIF
jgi:hypothetical protein